MYIPQSLQMQPNNSVEQFINDYGFGVLFSESLDATHLPFLLESKEGEMGILYSHMARANPHWKSMSGQQVLVVFSGPHGYISPTWYASKPAVPTWNYAAVHVYGTVEILPDNETANVLEKTLRKYEPSLFDTPEVSPDAYRDKLSKAIVSMRISIDKIEAKHKLGQHRSKKDQLGVYRALAQSKNLDSISLARYMERTKVGKGG